MGKLNKLGLNVFWIIPILILLSPIILLLFIAEFFANKKRKFSAKKFFEDNRDKYYFFYSNKNGWGDFILNNVIPVLPEEILIFNTREDRNDTFLTIKRILEETNVPLTEAKLPFLVKLCTPTPEIVTLQSDFNKVKKNAKRDLSIQSEIKRKIDKIVN